MKEFHKNNNTRALSFASSDDLMNIMSLTPGKVTLFLDNDFFNDLGLIGVHPNDNTATVWLNVKDLIEIVKQHGNTVNIVQI